MSKAAEAAASTPAKATAPATPCPYQCPFPLTGTDVDFEGMKYKTFSMKDHETFRKLADSIEADWKLRFDENGTFTWDKKVKDEPMRMIKVFGVLPDVSCELLYDVLQDAVYRAVWDERRLDGYRFTMLDSTCEIGYYAGKLGFALDDREFINQRGWINPGNGEFQIFNTSVPITRMAKETKGRTRAISKVSGYLIRRWGEKGSSITYVTQTDPRGWIPSSIINAVTTRVAPTTIQTLRAACLKYPDWVKSQGDKYNKTWTTPVTPYPVAPKNNIYDFATERAKQGSGAAPPALLAEGPEASPMVEGPKKDYWVDPASPAAAAGETPAKNGTPSAGGEKKEESSFSKKEEGTSKKADETPKN